MEQLKHECGVALVRLLKPQQYYQQKYGTSSYGLNKLYLMMEKQHNRGQEGAGIACVNMNSPVGTEYMLREKGLGKDAIAEIFSRITPEWSIWGTCVIRRPARADSNTFTLSCAEITGVPRTSASAAISI